MNNRYKNIEVEAASRLSGAVKVFTDPRSIGQVLRAEIRAVGGAAAFGVECPTFGWFLAGGYYRLLFREEDPHFNIDLAMKQLSSLPGRPPIDFFRQVESRMSQPANTLVNELGAKAMKPGAPGPGIPHEAMRGTLMVPVNPQDRHVFAAPPMPCLNGADPASREDLLEDWFRQLQDILKALKDRFGSIDVALNAGGTVPVPDWFSDWCQQMGIQIRLIESNSGSVPLQ